MSSLLSAAPSKGAEKVECGQGAKIQIVSGVIVCTVTEKVEKVECTDATLIERIPVYHTKPSGLQEIIKYADIQCGKIIGVNDSPPSLIVSAQSEKGLSGYKRLIAKLDLPRERVNMEMWGIQISSADSERLASVMDQVKNEIDLTRKAMHEAYSQLTVDSRKIVLTEKAKEDLKDIGYEQLINTGMDGRQRLSLPDVLVRISLGTDDNDNDADTNDITVYNTAAFNLCKNFARKENSALFAQYNRFEGRMQEEYALRRLLTGDGIPPFSRPFQRFQEVALHQKFPSTSQPKCGDGKITGQERIKEVKAEGRRRRETFFSFLKSYRQSVKRPDAFDPGELITSASQLDGVLSQITDALNQDIEKYFIRPTLNRIKKIVGRHRNVEYAEVGRTTVEGLNGVQSKVASTTATTFDEPTPLRLDTLIKDASSVRTDVDKLFPTLPNVPLAAGANSIDASTAISLLAALSKEDIRWRALSSGVNLTITPTVLRDRTAAQLDVILTISDPAIENKQASSTSEKNQLRNPSRISSSTLTTKVNVNTMDLFALSTFNNQTTVTGRRWYVPVVGPMWEGVFGDIPVVGNLLAPKRPPINVQHQSIILTNTLIVPTAMGLTEWYNLQSDTNGHSSSINYTNDRLEDIPPPPSSLPPY